MIEEEDSKKKTKIPMGIRKQKQAIHSHWGKVLMWVYIAFAFFTIAVMLKPEGGEQTIIHSNRYDVDIVYDRALTKEELPTFDPIVWERDHIKSEDFTIKYVDQSAWDYDRFHVSSVDIAWILMIPILFIGVLQVIGTFVTENKIKRVVDFSDDMYFSKRGQVRYVEKGYYEITLYDVYKIPILGIYWLRNIGYTVRAYEKLVLINKDDFIVLNGRIVGYDVVIEKRHNYKQMIETMIELNHANNVILTQEGVIRDNYRIPATIVEDMMGLIENVVKAVQKAEGGKKNEEEISQKAVTKMMKIVRLAKGMDKIEQ